MSTFGRPTKIRIEVTDEQETALRQVARQAVGRVSERAHFVLLSAQGKRVAEIATLMGYSLPTVYVWLERYQASGVAGLDDEPRSGRPLVEPYLTAIVQAQASQPPPNSGYLATTWTVGGLLGHLKRRFKVVVSGSTLRRALDRAGFTWGRPKLVLPTGKDPAAEAKLTRLNTVLADPAATIIAEDESDLHLLPVLRAMWHRRNEQPQIPTPGQNRKRPIFGAVNLRTGAWHYQLTTAKRSLEFIVLLESLLLAYATGMIYVLVDNASIHTSKAVQAWLIANPRRQLVYLPAYAGHQYNPIEKVWWKLKGTIAADRCYKTLVELDQAIHRHFANATKDQVLQLINSAVTRQAQAALTT